MLLLLLALALALMMVVVVTTMRTMTKMTQPKGERSLVRRCLDKDNDVGCGRDYCCTLAQAAAGRSPFPLIG
jgi:hypothetical protein